MRSLYRSLLVLCLSAVAWAQQASTGSGAVVPMLVNFSGMVRDVNGKPLSGVLGVTFLLYKESQGGTPLWMETQNVEPDKTGHYSVMLGSTASQGLRPEVFSTGEARWLGVQVQGQEEAPRILLLSVPYALKAADAQTLGGLPSSAFVLAPTGAGAAKATVATPTASSSSTPSAAPPAAPFRIVTTSGGTVNALPMFTGATNIQNSIVTETSPTTINVAGKLGINTTAPSPTLDVSSGNAIVRGVGNFKAKGNTATLYIGDISHRIEAIHSGGLAFGAFKAPEAIFIADVTGSVGIGTTTPTTGILNTVANSSSVVGLSTVGWSAPFFSGDSGTDAIHATGGDGDLGGGANAGAGVIGRGGAAETFPGAGAGVIGFGGGAEFSPGGPGMVATGGTGNSGGTGVIALGGASDGFGSGGTGVVAVGDVEDGGIGDGIDAFSFCGGPCPFLAGSFGGDVAVSGNLKVSGTKSFQIDHPLDPGNKYLYHAALESSEVLNLYSGNAVLDASGEAAVQLPDWFETLNRDFRYQLTALGAPAPNLHIAQEIQNHSFRIAGGLPGIKVSWQVTGIRQDAWEKAHPMAVEVAKPPRERGYYINPKLFGAPPEKSIAWARNPRLMQRVKDMQEKQSKTIRVMLAKPGKSAKP